METNSFYNYAGKTEKLGDGVYKYHLLPYHLLDAAAVSNVFLKQRMEITDFFCEKLGFDKRDDFINFFCFFSALHDIGKFSNHFQAGLPKIEELFPEKKIEKSRGKPCRHDQLGIDYYQKILRKTLDNEIQFKGAKSWAAVSIAHHGKFLKTQGLPLKQFFMKFDDQAIEEWASFLEDFFWKKIDADLEFLNRKKFKSNSKSLSWWAAGIIVLSDWIASGSPSFCYLSEETDLETYWNKSLKQAEKALKDFGLYRSKISGKKEFSEFFPYNPTPLQREVYKESPPKGRGIEITPVRG